LDEKIPVEDSWQKTNEAAEKIKAPKHVRRYRTLVFQTYLVISLSLFFILALLASTIAYFPIDILITQSFQALEITGLGSLLYIVSFIGYAPQIFFVAGIVVFILYYFGFYREALAAIIFAGISQVLNTLLKFFIQRPRPSNDLVDVITELQGYSFPSGHVMFYVGFFGFLAFLSFTLLKQSWLRTILLVIFVSLVVLVGPSRVYLGEHWASDVLGAYLVGSLTLIFYIHMYRLDRARQKK